MGPDVSEIYTALGETDRRTHIVLLCIKYIKFTVHIDVKSYFVCIRCMYIFINTDNENY